MNSIKDLKNLFENRLGELEKEREDIIKSRIQSFNNRHKQAGTDHGSSIKVDGKAFGLPGNHN